MQSFSPQLSPSWYTSTATTGSHASVQGSSSGGGFGGSSAGGNSTAPQTSGQQGRVFWEVQGGSHVGRTQRDLSLEPSQAAHRFRSGIGPRVLLSPPLPFCRSPGLLLGPPSIRSKLRPVAHTSSAPELQAPPSINTTTVLMAELEGLSGPAAASPADELLSLREALLRTLPVWRLSQELGRRQWQRETAAVTCFIPSLGCGGGGKIEQMHMQGGLGSCRVELPFRWPRETVSNGRCVHSGSRHLRPRITE